jgi:cellulose synthase (UDP-forming)
MLVVQTVVKLLYRQPVARVIAIVYGLYLIYYLGWRATSTLNPDALAFSILLLLVESSALVSFGLFAFMTWDVTHRPPFRFSPGKRVDILVPTYDEGASILERTLVGCGAITYPHTTYVLDDGRRPEIEEMAVRLGCVYLTRPDNNHAKAGNLNAALARTRAQFILILDADAVPQPDILDKTLGYFTDERVALVQLPQDFYNLDSVQHASRVDLSTTWHEQELFYRVIQPGKNRWNAAFWCGSPSVIRRAALESIGGVAMESITEDLQTTLRLHAGGWKTVYHSEVLAYGIAAQTLHAFSVQRSRWAQGTMQLLRSRENPLLLRGLSVAQRLNHLASMITYFEAYQKLIYMVAAPITLLTGILPLKVGAAEFVLHWLPYFALGVLANVALGRGSFKYLRTEQYNLLKMFTFIAASVVLIWRRPLRFRVTPKRADASAHTRDRRELLPHALLLAFVGAGALVGLLNLAWGFTARYPDPAVVLVTLIWAVASGGLLASTVVQVLRRLHGRSEYRFPVPVAGLLTVANGAVVAADSEDLSVQGCSLIVPDVALASGITVLTLQLPDAALRLSIDVVHDRSLGNGRRRLGVRFHALSPADRELLIEFLYVTVARYQSDTRSLRELLMGEERVDLAA